MALELLARKWKVFATALEVDSMVELQQAGCTTLALDVTNAEQIRAAAVAVGPKLDLLINNAAVEGLGPLLDTDAEKLLDMYRINVVGPLAVTQALSEALIASRGCVVNIGSVGVYGLPFHGVYASSKAALQILSDVLRRETAPLGLRVITVELGMVMTAMLRAEKPFELSLPEPERSSHFRPWYTSIAPKYRGDIEKRQKDAMSASTAAKQILDAVDSGTSGKIWAGAMAWIFRWLWPLLSTARQDKINSDLVHVKMLKA